MRTVFSAALITLVVSMRRHTKYIRLPSGYTFPKPLHMNSFNLLPASPTRLPATSNGALVAPPRATDPPSIGHSEIPQSTALATYHPAPSIQPTSPGLSYSEFKQIMHNKIIEKIVTGEGTNQPELIVPSPEATSIASHKTVDDKDTYINNNHITKEQNTNQDKKTAVDNTFSALGGAQFYQSMFRGKNGFSPLSFLLSGVGDRPAPLFVPVPIVVPPPPPPPPGPKCYTNLSGFLCCNITLERTMEKAYLKAKSEGISLCNVQRMATAVQQATQDTFKTSFETIASHKDFVAKVNFAGDLNCKIEVDGKFLLAYATPIKEREINIIDAHSFFSDGSEELFDAANGTDSSKPTYIVYGPIRRK